MILIMGGPSSNIIVVLISHSKGNILFLVIAHTSTTAIDSKSLLLIDDLLYSTLM